MNTKAAKTILSETSLMAVCLSILYLSVLGVIQVRDEYLNIQAKQEVEWCETYFNESIALVPCTVHGYGTKSARVDWKRK